MSEVRAGGGVVLRQAGPGRSLEVVLVHRPRYDDWSLPKGKAEVGEAEDAAALREVEEETGLACRLGAELSPVRYRDARGRQKVVRYWSMSATGPGRPPEAMAHGEVDAVEWLEVSAAGRRLSYGRDRDVLEEAVTLAKVAPAEPKSGG
jgi:8-oxo-dGTP pyrophosphatase MutT (NUDIX family)